LPGAVTTPVPSSQFSRFPVKPLKIVSALPEEFYPVDLGGDFFANETNSEDTGADKED